MHDESTRGSGAGTRHDRDTVLTSRHSGTLCVSKGPLCLGGRGSGRAGWMPRVDRRRGVAVARGGVGCRGYAATTPNTAGHSATASGYPTKATTSSRVCAMTSGMTRPHRW